MSTAAIPKAIAVVARAKPSRCTMKAARIGPMSWPRANVAARRPPRPSAASAESAGSNSRLEGDQKGIGYVCGKKHGYV